MEKLVILSWILLLLAILSCAPRGVLEERSASPPQIIQDTLKEAWEMEWGKTLAAAKNEGKVVVHLGTGIAPSLRQELTQVVKSKYGITLEMIVGRARELGERIIREHRSGLYVTDLYLAGAGTAITYTKPANVFEEIEPMLLLPEVMDPRVWWSEKLPFVDNERKFILAFSAAPSGTIAYNADYISKQELQSYRDLLNPKWKSKIVMNDPTIGGAGDTWVYVVGLKIMGIEYLKELAMQNLVFTRALRQMSEWIARGKYPIGIAAGGAIVEMQKAGVPLYEHTPKEGGYLSSSWGNLALYKKAPHPNASRMFINWLLSKEGQIIFSKGQDLQNARIDVPTDFLTQTAVRQPGIKYFDVRGEEAKLEIEQSVLLARDIFNLK